MPAKPRDEDWLWQTIGETGRTFSLFNAGAFSHALDKLLGVPIDTSTPDALYDFVKKPCLQERVLLYERV